MAADERLDRLSRQLAKQSLGPVDTLMDQTLSEVGSIFARFTGWLSQAANDQPIMTLLLSCQAGYLVARLGRHLARRRRNDRLSPRYKRGGERRAVSLTSL